MQDVYSELGIPIDLLVLLLRAQSLPLEQPYVLPFHCAAYLSSKHVSHKDNVDVPRKIFFFLSRRMIYLLCIWDMPDTPPR